MKEIKLKVIGMKCEGCENRIKRALELFKEINEVNCNHQTGEVKVKLNQEIDRKIITEKIEDLGFEVVE